jgi:hypothetical protein
MTHVAIQWIPGFLVGSFKPLSPIPNSAKVRYLMSDDGTRWEEDTVRAFFHDELAELILRIPISRRLGADFVSWLHDKFWQYTVWSAYNLARTAAFYSRQGNARQGASSDTSANEKEWKALWSIQAPAKMKVVLWRLVHDCLPTGHQLQRHHIPDDDSCAFCGHSERVEHLFLFCPFARAVWDQIKEQFQCGFTARVYLMLNNGSSSSWGGNLIFMPRSS